jgi:hypothetical protein
MPNLSALKQAWHSDSPATEVASAGQELREQLLHVNQEFLALLAKASPLEELELAYALGRSLSDTVAPPPELSTIGQLRRQRVVRIRSWLTLLALHFPNEPTAAIVVGTSLGRWSVFVESAGFQYGHRRSKAKGNHDTNLALLDQYLRDQGDSWLMLLLGSQSLGGLLTPEATIAAGEAALSRSANLAWSCVKHFWLASITLLSAIGGTLSVAVLYAGGAAKVWSFLGTIAAGAGVSWRSVALATKKLAVDAETPVWQLEKADQMAWAITSLPPIKLSQRATWKARRGG